MYDLVQIFKYSSVIYVYNHAKQSCMMNVFC